MATSTSDPELLNRPNMTSDPDSPGGAPKLPLHLVGTQSFLPSLLARVRSMAAAPTLPLEQVVFQSILLCLIAGDNKHLILRTVEHDVGLVVKLVVWTLTTIFDIPTRRLRLRPPAVSASAFVHTPTAPTPSSSSFGHTPSSAFPAAATASWNTNPTQASRRLKPKCATEDPETFLRALFMPSVSAGLNTGDADAESSEDEFEGETQSARHAHQHQHQHRKQYSHSAASHAGGRRAKHRTRHAPSHAYTAPGEMAYARTSSVPSNLVGIANANAQAQAQGGGGLARKTSPESMLMGSGISQQAQTQYNAATHDYPPSTTSARTAPPLTMPTPIFRPKPVYPKTAASLNQGLAGHAYTDPIPIPTRRPRSPHTTNTPLHHRQSGVSTSAPTSVFTGKAGERELPRALVLSGLEDASVGVQRALAGVLGEGRVVLREEGAPGGREGEEGEGEHELPEDFFVVYVCPWSACERPGVHKTLLDRFAMSTNLFVPQNIRRDFQALHFSLPKPSAQQGNGNNNASVPSSKFKFFSHSNPGTPSPSQALPLPQTYTPPVTTSALPSGAPSSSMHHRASSYSSNHSPTKSSSYTHHSQTQSHYTHQTHQTQYTHQTQHTHRHSSYATLHPPTQTHAHTYPGPSTALFPVPPIPASFMHTLRSIAAEHTYIAPGLSLYMADIFSAARHHHRLDGMLLGRAATKDAEALVRASRVLGADLTGMELLRPVESEGVGDEDEDGDDVYRKGRNGNGQQSENGEEEEEDEDDDDDDYSSALDVSIHNEPLLSAHPPSVTESALPAPLAAIRTLDVSEVNVARIVPRVISHRVRLRSGPEEEVLASVLFGATFRPPAPSSAQESQEVEGDESGLKSGQGEEGKRTEVSVKAVLVQILAEV